MHLADVLKASAWQKQATSGATAIWNCTEFGLVLFYQEITES